MRFHQFAILLLSSSLALAEAPQAPPAAPKPDNYYKVEPNLSEAEAAYAKEALAFVSSQVVYPTGREVTLTRPEGTVRIWIVTLRSGQVIKSGIMLQADSRLLNQAARDVLKKLTNLPAWPETAWPSEEQRRFEMDLRYVLVTPPPKPAPIESAPRSEK